MNKVEIVTNGERLSGWDSVSITRSINHLSGEYSCKFSDAWVDQFPEVYVGLDCQVEVDGSPLITGYIDEIEPMLSSTTVEVSLTGREKTSDLIDCNLISPPFSWKNRDIYQIAKDICNKFGIDVRIESAPGEKFTIAAMKKDEKIFTFLSRLAKQRNFILTTDFEGVFVITSAGRYKAYDSLEEGRNIKLMSGKFSFANRFSDYKVKGQKKVKGEWTDKTISVFGTSEDQNVLRYRPLQITPESQVTEKTAQELAAWEAQVRAGKSAGFDITVAGWEQSNGDFWSENIIVPINSPTFRIKGDYLVESITYNLTPTSINAILSFVDPRTYKHNPVKVIEPSKKQAGTYGWVK